ncbi:SDR family oxidoreductase [Hydrogenophaga sp.]|uniref:SDR family oxidoreductase n=1 Tax=Hydrogenophaga sp. TaxID=1904254 RepID=UPI0027266140|nr:SDR family oxidoreductase [Hydrogenophaga sp.]MDO9435323.1 SDR family oxidoreductase [Hydrogenophaga sp.]
MSTFCGGSGGAIVNVSSMAATIGGRPGASAYAASKAAVDCFTTGFAREVAAEGIRVNVVRPGVVVTEMTHHIARDSALRARVASSIPMQRLGRPEEIADIVLWLLSDSASLVTGAHVDAGGGGFMVGSLR